MNPGAANLYIYYRVRPVDVPRLIAELHAMHSRWRSELPGLACGLNKRIDEGASEPTLMETYIHPEGLSLQWQQLIESCASQSLGSWIVGERHVERFAPCA